MRNGYHPGAGDADDDSSLKKQGFYHKPVWRRIRTQALQRDHYLCQLRTSSKCSRIATEVHHTKSLEDYPELGLDLNNLTSCCWWCHEETKERRKRISPPPMVRVIPVTDGTETEGWKNAD